MPNETVHKLFILAIYGIGLFFYPALLIWGLLTRIYRIIYPRSGLRKSIKGDVAVVTGGASGLGKAIAEELAKHGCHIAIVDINLEQSKFTAKLITEKYEVKAIAYKVDVTNFEQVAALNENVIKELGVPTILVNNAGIMLFSNIFKPAVDEIQRMIDVNLTSHFWTKRVFLPGMKRLKKGHIVAISSASGLLPLPFNAEYTSTKFAVRGLMRCLRQELIIGGFNNIKATTVFPYFLNSNSDVLRITKQLGIDMIYPPVETDKAAGRIVNGILRDEREVVIPEFFALAQRLIDNLPSAMQDTALSLSKAVFQDQLIQTKRID